MSTTNVRISGNHINELSENIPSNIFALNELIKNSYDACASYCAVKIDKEANEIIIVDNGKGFKEESINELFHLSKSSKRFGKIQKCGDTKRRVQGSKGLGFLAAFRFGNNVTWESHNGTTKYDFGASKTDLIALDDIAEYEISIKESGTSEQGTKITIDSDESIINQLVTYFKNESNYLKLVGAFNDRNFEIILDTPNGKKRTNLIPKIKDINPSDQLFYVRYSSISKSIEFYRNGYLDRKVGFNISSSEYDLDIEVMIYNLRSYGRDKISRYFYKPDGSGITPLVFINGNLFNNYSLFDPDVFRSVRSQSSLPQMIGYVSVESESQYFEFNSDRTNFVENEVTSLLKEDIVALNKKIQAVGAELKNEAKTHDGNLTGPAYPKRGGGNWKKPLVRAEINLKSKEDTIFLPSNQIDLLGYVKSVTDTEGKSVPKSNLDIKVDNKEAENNILPSFESPKRVMVRYSFNDPNSGVVIETLLLIFEEKKSSVTGSSKAKRLFYISGSSKDYSIQIEHVAKIMEQISVAHEKNPKFTYLIACSLRTVFELSSKAARHKRPEIFRHTFVSGKPKYGSLQDIIEVVTFIENNNKIMTQISHVLGVSYQSLRKFISIDEFEEKFDKSNLGAHSGAQFLSGSVIEDIAKIAGYYAAFCDVLIYHVDDSLINNATIVDIRR